MVALCWAQAYAAARKDAYTAGGAVGVTGGIGGNKIGCPAVQGRQLDCIFAAVAQKVMFLYAYHLCVQRALLDGLLQRPPCSAIHGSHPQGATHASRAS